MELKSSRMFIANKLQVDEATVFYDTKTFENVCYSYASKEEEIPRNSIFGFNLGAKAFFLEEDARKYVQATARDYIANATHTMH